MPGMTRGFWRDRERYQETYWSRLPGIWVHGDWASIDEDGFWYIHGRSDDTLKVAGKRVGPAEVESAAVAHPAVLEAAAIGVPHEIKGEAIVVLCVLRPGETDDDELAALDRQARSPTSWASRSSRRPWRWSPRCRRRARARSCAGSSERPGWASTRATSPRSTTHRPLEAVRAVAVAAARYDPYPSSHEHRRPRTRHRQLGRARSPGPRARRAARRTTVRRACWRSPAAAWCRPACSPIGSEAAGHPGRRGRVLRRRPASPAPARRSCSSRPTRSCAVSRSSSSTRSGTAARRSTP